MHTALVIDDQLAMRRLMSRILTALGHHVVEAASGEEGLAMFERYQPALVVTDIVMPGMEGIETIMRLRRLSRETRIIAVSGADEDESGLYLDAARKLGADRVVRKPFRDDELEAAVRELEAQS